MLNALLWVISLLCVLLVGVSPAGAVDTLPARITLETVPMILAPGNLPDDPGPAGMATLGGRDINGNGVRDDAERWIGENFPKCARYRAALSQVALVVQRKILAQNLDEKSARLLAVEEDAALNCFVSASESCGEASIEKFIQLSVLLQNTPARAMAYVAASRPGGKGQEAEALSGGCMIPAENLPN